MDPRHNNKQRGGKKSQQAKKNDLNRHKPDMAARRNENPNPNKYHKQDRAKDIFVDIDSTMTSETPSTIRVLDQANSTQQVNEQTSSSDTHIDIPVPQPEETIPTISTNQSIPPKEDHTLESPSSASTTEQDKANSLDVISNLTRLSTASGSEVYLIGTAHFSSKSVQDVQTVVRTVKPNAVILELCEERAFMLQLDEESLLEQNRKLSFDKIRSAIVEKGLAQGLIYIMFVKMSANLTEKLGMAPGAEFRAGSNEAIKVPGCGIILGDRSLKVTIARAVNSLSLWQKMKLVYQVLLCDISITQEDVEKCKDKDILEQMLQELGGEFPGFKRVLLDERNIYLAHSIYNWSERSVTSQGPAKVVAIVGCGHVPGIVENWGSTTDDDCRKIIEIPKRSKTSKVIGKTIKYCSLALLLYVGYRTVTPTSIQTAIYDKIATASNQLSLKMLSSRLD